MAMICPDCQQSLDDVPVGDPCPQCGGERRGAVVQGEVALAAVSALSATVEIGYNPASGWTDQWRTIQRHLTQLREQYRGNEMRGNLQLVDTVDALFLALYHLRDWLYQDRATGLSDSVVDNHISNCPRSLGVCRAYANTRKHMTRDKATALEAKISKTSGGPGRQTATITYWPKNQPASITEVDALDLAERSEQNWRALLTAKGIPVPPP